MGCSVASCSSTASLTFQSNPGGAEVWVSPLDGTSPKKLGQTPLSTTSDEAQKVAGTSGPVMIEFRKDGYLASRSMVTDLVPADIMVTAQLQRSSGLENIEALNGVVDRLFESQRLVRAGRLDDALKLAGEVERDAPELSAVYEIQGGIYYLQKKPREALDAYQVSIRYNPKNAEAIRMRNYLMANLGITPKEVQPMAPGGAKTPSGTGEGR